MKTLSTTRTVNPLTVFLCVMLAAAAFIFADTAPAFAQAFVPADKAGQSIVDWLMGAKWLWVLLFIVALLAAWSPRVPFGWGGLVGVVIIIAMVAGADVFVDNLRDMATK